MKFLRRLVMKRRRRSSEKEQQETNSLDETNSSSTSAAAADLAPWRVETVLPTGAHREADWWEEHKTSKIFRNRGRETWETTRYAWKHKHNAAPIDPRKLARQPSMNLKRELVQTLRDKNRACTLPRKIPLSAMIDVYQNIWNGNDGSD